MEDRNLVQKFPFFMWMLCLMISMIVEGISQKCGLFGLGIISGMFMIYAMYHDNLEESK